MVEQPTHVRFFRQWIRWYSYWQYHLLYRAVTTGNFAYVNNATFTTTALLASLATK